MKRHMSKISNEIDYTEEMKNTTTIVLLISVVLAL